MRKQSRSEGEDEREKEPVFGTFLIPALSKLFQVLEAIKDSSDGKEKNNYAVTLNRLLILVSDKKAEKIVTSDPET